LKILLDQNAPRPLAKLLVGHEVKRAAEFGWAELKNGMLLTAGEDAGFDVLLSGDKTIPHEQNIAARKIALVCMSDNHWPIVKHHVPAIFQAIEQVAPGEVRTVYCGASVPRRFRKPGVPS
jgi:hypothetical protein